MRLIRNMLSRMYSGLPTPVRRSSYSNHLCLKNLPTSWCWNCEYRIYRTQATPSLSSSQTAAALGTFFLAMLHNPDVQTRARQELDAVVGKERLPTLEDESSLPYITAVVKEGLRWRPVAPAGLSLFHSDESWSNTLHRSRASSYGGGYI